jgi:hypothetical protein
MPVTPSPGREPRVAAAPNPGPGLSAEQLQVIAAARLKARKITRAALVAAFSGWSMACFAFLTILGGLFSLPELALGLGLAVVAWVELRGSKQLKAFDLTAPRRLGFNQVALATLLFFYGSWGLYQALVAPSPYEPYLEGGGQMAELLEPIDRLNRMVMVIVYAVVLVVGVTAPLCASAYYFTRRGHIMRYVASTPKWVVETIRIAAG